MLLFEAMSILETRDTAVWFDHANNRFEGDATIPETGLYSGRPFEEILVESGLLPDACAQLCDVFHTDDDNPELGIESSLQHITIGDNKGGSHLPSVIIELVPDHKFSSSLIAIKSDPATKVIKKQRMRPDGTFRLIGSGADVAYHRLPERMCAALSRGGRARRQGAGSLQPLPGRRRTRPAPERAVSREHR